MAKIDPKILDRCLLRIQSGQSTVAECLAENPEQADALEPLLKIASVARAQLTPAGPSQAFLTNSTKRVMNLTKARLKASVPAPRPRLKLRWQPAYRLAAVLMALALLMGSVGVAYASADALPGDNLYGVKRGLERAALVASLSAEGDAQLWLEHADRRITEVEELVRRGRGKDLGPALEGYEHAVRKGLEIASEHRAGLGDLEAALGNHEQVLAGVLAEAPEQAIPGLTRAYENSIDGRNAIEKIRSGERPSDAAPGQLKKTPDALQGATELPPGQLKKDDAQGRGLPPGQVRKTETAEARSGGSD